VAREVINRVQRMRKEAGLAVSDRIRLWISGDALVQESVETHRAWIAAEVLATSLVVGEPQQVDNTLARQSADLDGIRADLALTKDE
jgi:isoleucyl-tRNA synthetase